MRNSSSWQGAIWFWQSKRKVIVRAAFIVLTNDYYFWSQALTVGLDIIIWDHACVKMTLAIQDRRRRRVRCYFRFLRIEQSIIIWRKSYPVCVVNFPADNSQHLLSSCYRSLSLSLHLHVLLSFLAFEKIFSEYSAKQSDSEANAWSLISYQ